MGGQNSCLFVSAKHLFSAPLQILLKSYTVEVQIKITDLSHVFNWDNLWLPNTFCPNVSIYLRKTEDPGFKSLPVFFCFVFFVHRVNKFSLWLHEFSPPTQEYPKDIFLLSNLPLVYVLLCDGPVTCPGPHFFPIHPSSQVGECSKQSWWCNVYVFMKIANQHL